MEPKITYIPLRNGYWGARIVGADHTYQWDELVTVTLKDGRKKEERISRVDYDGINQDGQRVIIAEVRNARMVQRRQGICN